jgi:hypothetical protein
MAKNVEVVGKWRICRNPTKPPPHVPAEAMNALKVAAVLALIAKQNGKQENG